MGDSLMVVARTPMRVSFAGGGSDLVPFAYVYGGAVVTTTIDRAVHVVVSERFEGGVRASYSRTEIVEKPELLSHDLIRESFAQVGHIDGGVEIVTVADVPARGSGLGASSAVTVGALQALYAYKGVMKTPRELAEEACKIEIGALGKPIGRQDQYAVAYGGLQLIRFGPGDDVERHPIVLTAENTDRLEKSLVLFWTGRQRSADKVLKRMRPHTKRTKATLASLRDLALDLYDDLRRGNPDVIGDYLDQGWKLKRELSGVSDDETEHMYAKALAAGAEGGKLLGAGGGGFFLLYVPDGRQDDVRQALSGHKELPLRLDKAGSRIVYLGE